jgi:hypothetical protein
MKTLRNEFHKTHKEILTVKIKEFSRVKYSETVIDFPFLVESKVKN